MGTTRLKLYNAALRLCGHSRLAALSDEVEGRRLLDDVWDDDGIRKVLEAGLWRFAMRSQELDYEPTVSPQFGHTRAFLKGTDWVRTAAVCNDEFFVSPLLNYQDEGDMIFADLDTIWVRFVSDDIDFGGDLANWPGSFQDYAAAYFAYQIIPKLTSDKDKISFLQHPTQPTRGYLPAALRTARSRDAQKDPTQFPPQGTWVRARSRHGGRRGPMGDGGTSGSLIG